MMDTSRLTRLPLLGSQQRLLQLGHTRGIADGLLVPFHASITVRLRGHLRTQDLLRAAEQVVTSQTAMRTRLSGFTPPACSLDISSTEGIGVTLRDLANVPAEAREKVARSLALEAAAQPFRHDASLCRMLLIRLDDEDHFFMLAMHHIIADNRSAQIVLGDILCSYDGISPVTTHGPRDPWLARLENGMSSTAARLARWQQQLNGTSDYLRLPVTATATAGGVREARAGLRPVVITPGQSARIRALAQAAAVDAASVLMAAFSILLSSWAQVRDLVIFMPRRDPELCHVVGPLEIKLPVYLWVDADETFSAVLARLRDVAAHLTQAPDVPLDTLARALWSNPGPVTQQVVFRFEDTQPAWRNQLTSIRITPFATGSPAADEALTWIVEESDAGFNSFFVYDSSLLSSASVEAAGATMQLLIGAALEYPNETVRELLQRSRSVLPTPHAGRAAPRDPAAQRELERGLAILWARALGLPHVGLDEHFFDLGGHSLMLPEMQHQITALTGLSMEIGTILQYPTVRKFSLHCESLLNARTSLTRAQSRAERWRRRSGRQSEAECPADAVPPES